MQKKPRHPFIFALLLGPVLFFGGVGCGVKGPPVPPIREAKDSVEDTDGVETKTKRSFPPAKPKPTPRPSPSLAPPGT